jgi:hypothetical protein
LEHLTAEPEPGVEFCCIYNYLGCLISDPVRSNVFKDFRWVFVDEIPQQDAKVVPGRLTKAFDLAAQQIK